MVSHGMIPEKFPEVLDWVTEQDRGEQIDFPVETITEDDDDDEDYDYALGSEQNRKNNRFNKNQSS